LLCAFGGGVGGVERVGDLGRFFFFFMPASRKAACSARLCVRTLTLLIALAPPYILHPGESWENFIRSSHGNGMA
jgi:hypothetical protein